MQNLGSIQSVKIKGLGQNEAAKGYWQCQGPFTAGDEVGSVLVLKGKPQVGPELGRLPVFNFNIQLLDLGDAQVP